MLGHDLALALDPALFAAAVGLDPDPWQADVLRSDAERMLLLCSRQAGKSTTAAVLALHTAIYHPGALVLLLSPSLRQSGELFRRVLSFYQALQGAVPTEAESALRLELANSSRIVSLPGIEATIRGFSSVALCVIDEGARVEDPLYHSVRPMLAISRGRLVAMSTPWGRRGWFFEAAESGADWLQVKIVAEQCPRISPAFLEEERRVLPAAWYEQEYHCVFSEMEGSVFSYDELMSVATVTDVKPIFGGMK